jgi:hypothetical protein
MSLPFYGPAQAVATGQARHAVVWRTVKEGSVARTGGGRPAYGSIRPEAEGLLAWLLPIGMLSPVRQVAPFATRYMHEYGLTREQLAWIPVTQRAHAARNPDAVYRTPLTVDDYLAARMISSPLCLYDCDVPADGATAIVVSAAESAPDLRAPVRIEAMAGVIDGRPSWDQWEDMGRVGHATAAAMWHRTDLRPADVDAAQLYDGFSIEAVWWLEAMGFCDTGEAGAFVYTLAILDSGLGMSAQDITAANRRLAGVESFTVAPSKYLGHYVAGNLAARHDIEVQLHNSPGTGVTATVELPASLLTAGTDGRVTAVGPPRAQRPLPPAPPAPAARFPVTPTAWAAPSPPSGLVRRTPPPGAAAGPDRPVASPTAAQLASLARIAGQGRTGHPPNGPVRPPGAVPGAPWPGGQLPSGPAGGPPPLARRDRGAQMPTTAPLHVPRTPSAGPADRPPARPAVPQGLVGSPAAAPTAGTVRAAEVYGFLSTFTAGVQRGLDAARARGEGPAG